ncbi:unnamed protein product [Penicillium salamii]|uniref:Zn(2)-C6 fungal-type domain-containing protein n=1 Tax=Penicillium salamii TaxID=1612424 RepID=A0A9W4IZ74_9EURO|nr:unnamed protein product [Penicillium salamii]
MISSQDHSRRSYYDLNASSATANQSVRQSPGTACLRCRDKKLKCDARKPQCGTCFASGVECVRSTNPRKRVNQMRDLQDRIDAVEQDIRNVRSQFTLDGSSVGLCPSPFGLPVDYGTIENTPYVPPFPDLEDLTPPAASEDCSKTQDNQSFHPLNLSDPCVDATMNFDRSCAEMLVLRCEIERNLVRQLVKKLYRDQIFMDRIHPIAPLLHRQRYFSWARSSKKTASQLCLQYALCTLAGSISTHLRHCCESFYQHTCHLLDVLAAEDKDPPQIEQIQACILLAYYDLTKRNFRRGWISTGRSIRSIQYMKLFQVDQPQNNPTSVDWVQEEEKRRAFWVTYTLDILISLLGEWPVSFLGYTEFVRLPAPEDRFQYGRSIEMPFLASVLSSTDYSVLSPFTESIIFATIIGNITANHHESPGRSSPEEISGSIRDKLLSLGAFSKSRLKALLSKGQNFIPPSLGDPMRLFTLMLSHASVLFLYSALKQIRQTTPIEETAVQSLKYESMLAADEIIKLSTSTLPLSCFKVHPFTPLILAKCVAFYNTDCELEGLRQPMAQQCYILLGDMSETNNLATECLSLRDTGRWK